MKIREASGTALIAATLRAEHQLADEGRIFPDPLAVRILGETPSVDDTPRHRSLRLFVAARPAFAERMLTEAYRGGARRVVVLGAGLDTFAYRNPYPDLHVIEVDHLDTQAFKHGRLAAGIPIPATLTYQPADFEHDTLTELLPVHPSTFFLWLGVTP